MKMDLPTVAGTDPLSVAAAVNAAASAGGNGSHPRCSPLQVIWQRRWIIITCVLVALVAAIVYNETATPIYEARADVYVSQQMPRILASDSGVAMSGLQNYLWTQCRLIDSRTVLQSVAEDPTITRLPTLANSRAMDTLLGIVSASVGRRDDVISISVRSRYPKDAAVIANAVLDAFARYHDSTKRSEARQILDLLQTQKGTYEKALAEKRKALMEFKTQNASFSFGDGGSNPIKERLARLNSELTSAQLVALQAESTYDAVKSMATDPVKVQQLLESRQFKNETASLRTELRRMRQELALRSENWGAAMPNLSALQESIRALKAEMEAEDRKLIGAYLAERESELLAARANEQRIASLLNQQREEVLQLNKKEAEFALLVSEIQSLDGWIKTTYDRIENLNLVEDAGALNVRVVEKAVEPAKPISPRKSYVLLFALALGGLGGGGLAFLRDWMDQRLRSVDEIKQVLNLPVLGVVPHIAGARTPMQRGMHLHVEPMSEVAEAYRTVRTAVYFGQAGGTAKTLLITSPAPGDGKTTLASNLAIAMAQAGNRILLLDADFRKPTQHKVFEIDKRIGLSNVLAGEVALVQAIHHTAVPGLDVLPCGPIPANPSEILNSQTFADMLEQLSARYDHVLLDSPPVMPVTDARILAASCDATVLALRAERSTRKGALYARDMLQAVGCQLLGVVVNDVPRKKGVYGYYYSYGEQYYYGYGRRRAVASDVRNNNGGGNANGNGAHAAIAAAPPSSAGPGKPPPVQQQA